MLRLQANNSEYAASVRFFLSAADKEVQCKDNYKNQACRNIRKVTIHLQNIEPGGDDLNNTYGYYRSENVAASSAD